FSGPAFESSDERLGFFLRSCEIEALDIELFGIVQRLKDDGDGAVGESFGEWAERSEGLGGEDRTFERFIGVADAGLEAADENGAELRIFGAGAGAEGGRGFVEEEGGKLDGMGVNALDQGGGGVAAGEGGMGGEEAEEAEAEGFAGEFAGRLDGEVGSGAGG